MHRKRHTHRSFIRSFCVCLDGATGRIRTGDLLLCRASLASERHGAQRSITNTFVSSVEPTSAVKKARLYCEPLGATGRIRTGDLLLCRASLASERHGAQRSITNTFVSSVEPTSAVKKARLYCEPLGATGRIRTGDLLLCRASLASERHGAQRSITNTFVSSVADFGRKKSSLILRASWSYWPDSNRRPADYESAALPAEPQ